jgi:hypothetical protein
MLRYHPTLRPASLDWQAAAVDGAPMLSVACDARHDWIEHRQRADVECTPVARPSARPSPLPLRHA